MKSEFYKIKNISYYNEWREDVFNVLLNTGKNFNRSLEIGCGSGILSRELKNHDIIKYSVGIEPYAKIVSDNNFNEFYGSDIETMLKQLDESEKFDLIILADVLEHTIDPWSNLNLLSSKFLKDGGIIVISLPNFRNILTLYKVIFKNSFKYENEGVFDVTHMRFFCIPDMKEMISNSQLSIINISPSYIHKKFKLFSVNRLKILNFVTVGVFKYLLADQIICVCKK
jgi:SAM-dependent methyltransferase